MHLLRKNTCKTNFIEDHFLSTQWQYVIINVCNVWVPKFLYYLDYTVANVIWYHSDICECVISNKILWSLNQGTPDMRRPASVRIGTLQMSIGPQAISNHHADSTLIPHESYYIHNIPCHIKKYVGENMRSRQCNCFSGGFVFSRW